MEIAVVVLSLVLAASSLFGGFSKIAVFSVAFEARIWLYVGLCCDAGGLDGVTVPAVATHRSFPTRMN